MKLKLKEDEKAVEKVQEPLSKWKTQKHQKPNSQGPGLAPKPSNSTIPQSSNLPSNGPTPLKKSRQNGFIRDTNLKNGVK